MALKSQALKSGPFSTATDLACRVGQARPLAAAALADRLTSVLT
jgi:hypothetical protein